MDLWDLNTDMPTLNMLHLWCVDVLPEHNSTYSQILTNSELERSAQFYFSKDRNTYIFGRAILRILSSSYLSCNPREVEFRYNDFGKPEYNFEGNLKFNLSHSGDKIILGFVSDGEIGVDIEKIKTDIDLRELAKTVFSESEIKIVDELNNQDAVQKFYELWTRKEAFIKGTGYGLSIPIKLTSLSVLEDNVEFHQSTSELPLLLNEDWVLRSIDLEADYRVAVAFNGKPRRVKCFNWDHPKS